MHVVESRGGRRGGARRAARLDHLSAALRHPGDELIRDPGFVVDGVPRALPSHLGVDEVRVLGGGVVAPDGHVRDLTDRHAELGGELGVARL